MPSAPLLKKLSQMYGVSIDYLLGVDTSSSLQDKKEPITVSSDGQIEKLAVLLRDYGIDVDGLTEPELLKLAKVIAAVLKD